VNDRTRLRNLGPSALLIVFLASTAFAFQTFVMEQGTFEDDGGGSWFVGMGRAVVGAGSVPLILATLLLIRRDALPLLTKLLFRIAAFVALAQAVLAMSWLALDWKTIYHDGVAWTQITIAFAAALVALVALQPNGETEADAESADGQQGVAVDGAAGEFGGATDAAEE
jgi:hypothetical protein